MDGPEGILTLVNAYQEAGIHKVNFDAAALSSGIYHYSWRLLEVKMESASLW